MLLGERGLSCNHVRLKLTLNALGLASDSGPLADVPVLPAVQVEVEGIVRGSEQPSSFVPANDPASGQWFWIDVPALARAAGLPLDTPLVEARLTLTGSTLPRELGCTAKLSWKAVPIQRSSRGKVYAFWGSALGCLVVSLHETMLTRRRWGHTERPVAPAVPSKRRLGQGASSL